MILLIKTVCNILTTINFNYKLLSPCHGWGGDGTEKNFGPIPNIRPYVNPIHPRVWKKWGSLIRCQKGLHTTFYLVYRFTYIAILYGTYSGNWHWTFPANVYTSCIIPLFDISRIVVRWQITFEVRGLPVKPGGVISSYAIASRVVKRTLRMVNEKRKFAGTWQNILNDLCVQREIRSASAQSDQILRFVFVLMFYGSVNY